MKAISEYLEDRLDGTDMDLNDILANNVKWIKDVQAKDQGLNQSKVSTFSHFFKDFLTESRTARSLTTSTSGAVMLEWTQP